MFGLTGLQIDIHQSLIGIITACNWYVCIYGFVNQKNELQWNINKNTKNVCQNPLQNNCIIKIINSYHHWSSLFKFDFKIGHQIVYCVKKKLLYFVWLVVWANDSNTTESNTINNFSFFSFAATLLKILFEFWFVHKSKSMSYVSIFFSPFAFNSQFFVLFQTLIAFFHLFLLWQRGRTRTSHKRSVNKICRRTSVEGIKLRSRFFKTIQKLKTSSFF